MTEQDDTAPSRPQSPVRFEPQGLCTGIGSLPHVEPREAVALVVEKLPEIPFWPQLPRRSPLEGMTLQYLKGFPGLRETGPGRDPVVDLGPEGVAELEGFYQAVLGEDADFFTLERERAEGFYAFEEVLRSRPREGMRFVKGHVTGPVTLASALKGGDGREILYDDTFREVVAAFLSGCIRWQVRRLSAFGAPVVVFFDEPVMEVYGSAYSSGLTAELVESLWGPCLEAAHGEGAAAGIHCCGNTDWGFLFRSGADIVNFDAYHYLEKMLLYPEDAQRFLAGGGSLAWGIVPTSHEARGTNAEALILRLEEGMKRFAAAGVDADLLRRQCLLTPSCGMGSLTPELSEEILGMLSKVSSHMRV